jgi:transposase InsO family protein
MDEKPQIEEQPEAAAIPATPSQTATQSPPLAATPETKPMNSLERRLFWVKEYLKTGGSQNAFCSAHELNNTTFNGWLNEYRTVGEEGMKKRYERILASGRHDGPYTSEQRRQAVETYLKSGTTVSDFARVWGISLGVLEIWLAKYRAGGPKALETRKPGGRPRRKGIRELIEKVKRENPAFGLRKVRDFLGRIAGVRVSTGSVRNALKDKGYPSGKVKREKAKRQPPRRFERACAGDLWQSDITSFVLPRYGQRVYLTVFLDDYSRYIVSWAVSLQQKQDLVIEALLSGIERFGKPKEVLTDQGRQYFSWRGKGDFQKLLRKEGIQHVVARTHHPQTVGKTERFWATVMEEFWERVQPQDLGETKERLGHFINHYNHFRPHQGIDGLVPADRFFGAANQVRKALEEAMQKNELLLAIGEAPRQPVYLVGQIGDQRVSMHGEKGKVVIQTPDGCIQEMGLDGLGVKTREETNGRGREGRKEADFQRAHETQVQVPAEGGLAGAGIVGSGEPRGERESAPDGGGTAGILDGTHQEGGSGAEAEHPALEGVAVVPAGAVGLGGGAGETAESGQEKDEGGPAARGGPEAVEQKDPGPGTGSLADEGTGSIVEGVAG